MTTGVKLYARSDYFHFSCASFTKKGAVGIFSTPHTNLYTHAGTARTVKLHFELSDKHTNNKKFYNFKSVLY